MWIIEVLESKPRGSLLNLTLSFVCLASRLHTLGLDRQRQVLDLSHRVLDFVRGVGSG